LMDVLNAVVLAGADEQPSARVDRNRVRLADLARPRAFLPPLLDERAGAIEFDDAVVLAVSMAVGDEDVAVGRDDDVRRLIGEIRPRAGPAGLAERHQD